MVVMFKLKLPSNHRTVTSWQEIALILNLLVHKDPDGWKRIAEIDETNKKFLRRLNDNIKINKLKPGLEVKKGTSKRAKVTKLVSRFELAYHTLQPGNVYKYMGKLEKSGFVKSMGEEKDKQWKLIQNPEVHGAVHKFISDVDFDFIPVDGVGKAEFTEYFYKQPYFTEHWRNIIPLLKEMHKDMGEDIKRRHEKSTENYELYLTLVVHARDAMESEGKAVDVHADIERVSDEIDDVRIFPRRHKKEISYREEANALICHCVRNGFIEELHAGKHSELLDNPKLSRITQEEMKKLMIESSAELARLLALKETNPEAYRKFIEFNNKTFTSEWDKHLDKYSIKKEKLTK